MRVVECLKCDNRYSENDTFIPTCPSCNNTDTNQTIYLEEEGSVYKTFMQEVTS